MSFFGGGDSAHPPERNSEFAVIGEKTSILRQKKYVGEVLSWFIVEES